MGTSTDAMLVYGYDLGSEYDGWKVTQTLDGELNLDWLRDLATSHDDEPEFVLAAMDRLLADAGFAETDWRATGYHERKRSAEQRVGVEFQSHCSGEYPMWTLAAKTIRVHRGDVSVIHVADLLGDPERHGWNEKLQHALDVLGITPIQPRPEWLLCSYWG